MKLNVLVGEIMTKDIKKVSLDDPISKAAQIMRENSIGSVVVMGEKQVKGIVTTTDIVYKHVAKNMGNSVKDIMSSDIVTVPPSATIENAARLMVKNGVEKLLVFDKGNLVGIITNNDILKVEPAIVDILIENMKMGDKKRQTTSIPINECESCGNLTDDIEEDNGRYLCQECREA